MPKIISFEEALGEAVAPQKKTISFEEAQGSTEESQATLRGQLKAAQEAPEATTIKQYPFEVGRAAGRMVEGASQLPVGLYKMQGAIQEGLLRRVGYEGKTPSTIAGEAIAGAVKKIPGTEDQDYWSNVQRGLGQVGGAIATGGVLGAAGMGARFIPIVTSSMMGGAEFDDAFQSAREHGDSPDLALAKSLGYATVAVMIENWAGAGRILRKVYPTKVAAQKALTSLGVSKEIVKNFVAGGAEEFSQKVAQDLIVKGEPDWRAAWEEGKVGAMVEGPVATVAMGGQEARARALDESRMIPGLPDELQGLPEPTVTLRKKRETKPRLTLKNEQAKAATEKTSIGFRILSKRGVDSDVATAVVNLVGEKQSDETSEQYRERINAAHDDAGFKSVQELALPFAPEQRIRDEMARIGESQDAIEQSVKTANDARTLEANKVRESNNQILRSLQFSVKKPITPTKGRANAQSPRTETQTPSPQQIVEQGEEERLRLRDAEKNRVETKVAEATPEAETKVLTPNPDWRVTVQAPQPLDETTTVPGYVQIDEVVGTENKWSQGPDKLRVQGYDIPDFSKLPSGKYTFAQAQKLLAETKPTPPPQNALTEAKPVATTSGMTTETAQPISPSPISVSEPDVQSSTPVERQDNAGRAGAKPALESTAPKPPVSPPTKTEAVSKPLPPERAGASTTITPETAPLPTPVVASKQGVEKEFAVPENISKPIIEKGRKFIIGGNLFEFTGRVDKNGMHEFLQLDKRGKPKQYAGRNLTQDYPQHQVIQLATDEKFQPSAFTTGSQPSVVASKPEPKKQANRASDFKVKDAQLTTEDEIRDRLKSVNRRREEGTWTPAKDVELKKLSKRAAALESRLADIFRAKIRAKQDEVIAIAERRGMDEDTPISSVQEQAPTIKELRAKIWPNFESSLDAFLSEFKQAEPTPSQSQLQAKPEIPQDLAAEIEKQKTGQGPLSSDERLELNELRIVKENRGKLGMLNQARLDWLESRDAPETRASEIKSTLNNWASKIDEARKGRNYSGLFGVDAVLYDAGLLAARNILQSQTFQSAAVAFDAAVQAAMKAIHSMLEGQLRLRPDLINSYKEDEMEAAIREGLRQTQHESIPPPAPPETEQAIQEQETQIDNAGVKADELNAAMEEAKEASTAAAKTGDRLLGERVEPTETRVFGRKDTVQGREGLGAERRQQGVEFAKRVFDEVGVRTVWDEESGLWVLDPKWEGSDEAGRDLRDRIESELRSTHARNQSEEQGDYLGNLLNSVVVAMTGDAVTQFSPAVKNELYATAQGERSFRGLLLAALRAMDHSITYMSRNVEAALHKIRFDALGGEQITAAMREAMAFFKREVLGENGNQKLFTDAELEELIKKMPKLQAEFERLLNEKRGEHGSRLYRAVQSLYTPHRRKKLAALEADAELQEAIAKIVADLKQRGIAPVVQVSNKLTPLKELLHMVDTTKDPTAQQAINDAINNAIGEAEINAGIDATLAAIEKDPQFTTVEERIEAAKELRALFESGELLPEKEMVEAGLNLPKYLHWKNLRDNLTSYSPITVKLARKVITGDFRGTKFASETPPAADARTLDFNKLAISPEAEVRRVFDNWMAELDAKMDLVNATPETRQGVMDVLKAEISDQYEKAKLRARESYFAAPKTSRPSPQDKLAQAINAGLFGDKRLNLDDQATRDAFISNVASKSAVRKLTPSLRSLIQDVLKTPYYKRQDLADEFAAYAVGQTRMSPEQAVNAAEVFLKAYNDKWSKAAQMAITKAKNALVGTQQKEARVRSKQGVWDKLVKAANSGYLDVGEVLRAEAKVRGWWEPSDQQIADVRELAVKLQRLSELTPKEKLEIEAAVEQARTEGKSIADQEDIRRNLTRDKLANVSSGVTDQRTIIKKKMELFWSKVSRPIGLKTAEGRANLANFMLEYSAAGMLTTPGFIVRQMIDVITQGLMHSPTRAFGMALEQRRKDIEAGDPTTFWRDALDNVRASFKARNSSIKDRLSAVAYTLRTGTNDLRNVERILSGIATFERVEEKVEELKKQGRNELALMLYIASMNKFAYRFAGAMDNLHGIPAEYQEIRLLVESKLRENGMTVEEARKKADWVMGDNQKDWMLAMQEASEILADRPRMDGKPHSASDLQSAAGHIVRGMKYQRIGELGIDAGDFQERLRLLRNTLGWNEREEGGFGGMAAKGIAVARRGFASMGIPVPSANFGNAIGIGINKVLTWATPIAATNWGQETFFGVDPKAIKQGTVSDTGSPFYRTPEDRAQRKIEAIVGSTTGAMVFTLAMLGFIAVRNKWPKDKEERDEWERLGLKPGTFDIPAGNGKVLTMSMTTGPFMIVRPWLAAGGAIQDLLKDRAKAQARLDLEAARRGVPAGKIKPVEFTDLLGVAMQAAWAAVGGGRTASGMLGSISDFGQFDLKKAIAGQLPPFVPFLPALRDISRLTGNRADSRFASFADLLLPLPTSGAAQVNFLGDPVGSGSSLERLAGQLSGGSVPWPRSLKDGEQSHAYKIIFGTEYRPPSINTSMGRNINGEYRPLTQHELVKYTKLRGQYFKAELNTLPVNATAGQAKIAYQRANERALTEIGVTPSVGGFGGTLRASTTKPSRAPRMTLGASLPSRRKTTAFKRYATRGTSRRPRLSLGIRRPRLTASRRTGIRKLSMRRPRLRLYA